MRAILVAILLIAVAAWVFKYATERQALLEQQAEDCGELADSLQQFLAALEGKDASSISSRFAVWDRADREAFRDNSDCGQTVAFQNIQLRDAMTQYLQSDRAFVAALVGKIERSDVDAMIGRLEGPEIAASWAEVWPQIEEYRGSAVSLSWHVYSDQTPGWVIAALEDGRNELVEDWLSTSGSTLKEMAAAGLTAVGRWSKSTQPPQGHRAALKSRLIEIAFSGIEEDWTREEATAYLESKFHPYQANVRLAWSIYDDSTLGEKLTGISTRKISRVYKPAVFAIALRRNGQAVASTWVWRENPQIASSYSPEYDWAAVSELELDALRQIREALR